MDPKAAQARAVEVQRLQQELEALEVHLTATERMLGEVQEALLAVQNLHGDGEREVLVPLGGGVQAHARIDTSRTFIVPVGAGYATEAPADAAEAHLKERLESLRKTYESTAQRHGQVAAELQRIFGQATS